MTREELLNIIETDHVQCGEAAALARMALAYFDWQDKTAWVQTDKRFDVLLPWGKHRADVLKEHIEHLENRITQVSEPVAWTDEEELRDVNVAGIGYLFGIDREANKFADSRRQIMLYRHAQPAPEYPEVLPCPVLLDPGMRFGKGVKTRLVLEAIQRRAEHYAELEAVTPEERAEYDAGIEAFKAMLPQPVQDNSAITQHFDTIAPDELLETFTRKRLLEIIVTGPDASGAEQNTLARIALSLLPQEINHVRK